MRCLGSLFCSGTFLLFLGCSHGFQSHRSWPFTNTATHSSPRAATSVWYSDPEVGRDRSHILSAPSLDEVYQRPTTRFVLSQAGSVFVRRDPASLDVVTGLFLTRSNLETEWLHAAGDGGPSEAVIVFVGTTPSGTDVFAIDLPEEFPSQSSEALAAKVSDVPHRGSSGRILTTSYVESSPLRQYGDLMLSKEDAAVYATANGLIAFHRSHPFCSRCGGATVLAKAGACRRCRSCGKSVYPRIDAAAIMLVTSACGEFALLGRKKAWPEGRWSTLAGFSEVGTLFFLRNFELLFALT